MTTEPRFVPRSVQAGEWTITALSDGTMRLDGGAMWGVVPAVLWRRLTPPDEQNRIALALRPFLCVRGDCAVLIEVGIGERWDARWRSIFALERSDTLVGSLAALGLAPEDVTHVVATHCHFDHIGAQVALTGGELVPQFPRARHFAPRVEIENAKHPDHVRRASYRADDVLPIERAGLLEPCDGAREIAPGLVLEPAPGHSDGVAVVTINAGGPGDAAIFWSDVVPTTHHVQPAYIMAYDIDVARSFESRSRWLARAADLGWIGLFYHDAEHAFARLRRAGERYAVDVLEGQRAAPSGARGEEPRG